MKSHLSLALATLALGCDRASEFDPASVVFGPDDIAWHSPEGALWDVSDVLEKDSVIWVLSPAEPFVRGLRSGEEAIAFGVRGEGPGELRSARALLPLGGVGRITVWDAAARLYRTFSSDGEPISESAAPQLGTVRGDIDAVTFGDPLRVAVAADGAVVKADFPGAVSSGRDLWTATLTRSGIDVEEEPVVDFRDLRGASHEDVRSKGLLVPVPLWDVCPDGDLVVFDPISRFLHLAKSSWAERDSLFVPWEPRPLRRSDRISYLAGRLDAETRGEAIDAGEKEAMIRRAEAGTRDQFPTMAPVAVDIRCGKGRAWMQEYDGAAHPLGFGNVWRTVAVEDDGGETRVDFTMPFPFRIFDVADAHLLGVATNDVGLQRVAKVPLPRRYR